MEDLNAYIILPMNGIQSTEYFPSFIQDDGSQSTSISSVTTNDKVSTNIQYVLSRNDLGEIYLSPISTQLDDVSQLTTIDTIPTEYGIKEEIFECPKCKSIFTDNEHYIEHVKIHETKTRFQCFKCEKCFDKVGLYEQHLLIHREEKPFNCTQCKVGFNSENNYKVHMAIHSKELVCPICDLKCHRLASLKSHVVIHQIEETLVCPECSAEFDNEEDLEKHIKKHAYDVPIRHGLICSYCKVKFDTTVALRKHIASHMKVKKLVFNGKTKGRKSQTLAKDRRHKCAFCSKAFPKLSLLERHTRIHTGERPFTCQVCERGFTQKVTLEIHMLKHEALKPYSCTLCPAKFTQKGNLKGHVERTHTAAKEGEKTFKCPDCDCIFKKVASLNAHISKTHAANTEEITITSVIEQLKNLEQLNGYQKSVSNVVDSKIEEEVSENNDQEKVDDKKDSNESKQDETCKVYSLKQKIVGNGKVYVCSYCEKETKKSSDMIRHLRTHTGERPYKCYCGKSFSLKSTLQSHNMRVHKGNFRKMCSKCPTVLFSPKTWISHKRKHDTIALEPQIAKPNENEVIDTSPLKKNLQSEDSKKPFKCQQCPASFRKKTCFKRHKLLHSVKAKFQCEMCFRSFSTEYLLDKHMRVHFDIKSHCCELCDQKFANKTLLNRHISIHKDPRPFECSFCHKKFKTMINCTKHINTHHTGEQQEETPVNDDIYNNIPIETSNNSNEQNAVLNIDSDGVVIDNFYITSENIDLDNAGLLEKNCIEESQDLTATLEIGEKENVQTIFLDCPEFQGEGNLNNYFISQLEPNDTIVLDESNDINISESSIVFNVQTVDDNNLPLTEDTQFYINNSTEKLIHEISDVQPNVLLESTDKIESVDNLIQNDITDNFLANNISLYPNTQISFDNSIETNSIQFNLVEQEQESLNSKENREQILDLSLSAANSNIIHCLACKKFFDSVISYESHECSKSKVEKTVVEEPKKDNTEDGKSKKPQKRIFECVHCRKEFHGRGAYVIHVNTHRKNEDGLHKCKFCVKKFKKPSDLNRHLRTHTGEKPFACDKCDKKFSLKSTLEGHYRTHNPGATKDFLCEVCNSFFSSKASRKLHMLIHTDSKPHKCSQCDQQFRTLAHRRDHEKSHLNRSKKGAQKKNKKIKNLLASVANLNDLNSGFEPENTGLTEIQLEFPNSTTKLTESIQIDSNLLQQLQNSNILLQDIDANILESPIQINEYTFQNLEKPNEIATNVKTVAERNLECDVCHKKYASKDVLRKHKQLHAKNKFVCDTCSKWFATSEALSEHEKLHSGYRPYSCSMCNNSFAELQHLKIHLKRIHKIMDTKSALVIKMSVGETLHM